MEKIYTIDEIRNLIMPTLLKYKIKRAILFGSYARGEATTDSDIDIMINATNIKSFMIISELFEELKQVLNKEIDLIEEEALQKKNKNLLSENLYKTILNEGVLLYEK